MEYYLTIKCAIKPGKSMDGSEIHIAKSKKPVWKKNTY